MANLTSGQIEMLAPRCMNVMSLENIQDRDVREEGICANRHPNH